MSADSLKERIRSLEGIIAGYQQSLRLAKTDHEKSQYEKFISNTENEISGLRRELKASYGQ